MRKAPHIIALEGYKVTAGYSAAPTSSPNTVKRPPPPKGWKQPSNNVSDNKNK